MPHTKKAQPAINFIISKLEAVYTHEVKDRVTKECVYGNLKFTLPTWFLSTDGHTLKEKCKKVFAPLQNLHGDEHEIEKRLINIVAKVYPVIPIETKTILEKIGIGSF